MRFAFGKNWKKYLRDAYSEERQEISRESLLRLVSPYSLSGRSFLDIGSGSGIHSLSALQLGCAQVQSFDFDKDSVNATEWVRAQNAYTQDIWKVNQGSILDSKFLSSLGMFDIVYSWGVLHHTGDLELALDHASSLVKDGGLLIIALYDDITYREYPEYWINMKIKYLQSNWLGRRVKELDYILQQQGSIARFIRTAIDYKKSRGMAYYTDVIDWLGGFPMQFSSIYRILPFFHLRGFHALKIITGQGNTEYVFLKSSSSNALDASSQYLFHDVKEVNWSVEVLRFPFELSEKLPSKPILIFGSTKYGVRLYKILKREGFTVVGFVESQPKGTVGFEGLRVFGIDDPIVIDSNCTLILAASTYPGISVKLFNLGRKIFFNAFPLVRNLSAD